MIVAIYKDDGPLNGCGQDLAVTAPRESAVAFASYEEFRRADCLLSEATVNRKNPRHIKWYNLPEAMPMQTVTKALDALRETLVSDAEAMATHGSGTSACTINDAMRATIAKLGLGAKEEE